MTFAGRPSADPALPASFSIRHGKHHDDSTTMDCIGYWITDLRDEEFCAPQEIVGRLPVDVRERLALYLDAGDCYSYSLGYSWCRFLCGVPYEEMGYETRHDGRWIWPEGLSHYVRTHGITLPDEFIEHALGRIDRGEVDLPTKPLDPDPFSEARIKRVPASPPGTEDFGYWIKWCATRRSAKFLERLRQARIDAEQRLIATEAAPFEMSERSCSRCNERALHGIGLCARHYVAKIPMPITRELMNQLLT